MSTKYKRYSECIMEESDCAACSLTNYNRDCHNNPVNSIAYYRSIAGLSQQQLSDISGVHKQQIYKLEIGKIDPENMTLKNALALAEALKCDVKEFVNG